MTAQPSETCPPDTANTTTTNTDPTDTPKPCNITTLDETETFTEGKHHWKPQKVLSREILEKSNHWPKMSCTHNNSSNNNNNYNNKAQPTNNDITTLSLRLDQYKLFGDLLQDDMHTWTSFHYMGMLERELLWLLEMSDLFKLKHQTNIDYMRQYMSPTLSEFVDKGRIQRVDRLIEIFFASLSPNIKMEFIAKRKKAKGAILQKIQMLRNLLADDAKSLAELYASSRWILLDRVLPSQQGGGGGGLALLKRNDVVYVAEEEDGNSLSNGGKRQGSNILFYRGKILGVKMIGGQVIYYTVFMDNATVEKVRQESLLTRDEMDALCDDVDVLMKSTSE
eukprot:CAMPEP_0176490048 /NCGR_PEP_ID=MMETSP0200_2-20121128/7643_1 /TAXON_ID=947934 /ORGANISM="Chaetoceros sp., Strain GSL56" /LENGTH=336 /DNA_ID=CAMNT_0017887289 /DNA_START=232 /DNA_END=1240 /DNA_ORIENTATION=+